MNRTAKISSLIVSLLALAGIWSIAARRGYVTPDLGLILNYILPPGDLYAPLASIRVMEGRQTYEFLVDHKYVGRYGVRLAVLRTGSLTGAEGSNITKDLTVILELEQNGKRLHWKSERGGRQFWGQERQGSDFCVYCFPEDLATRGPVLCRVVLGGDLAPLLRQRGDPLVEICKQPDE